MEVDDHEWELSKENVQPLRQGRRISSLVAALHSDQGDDQHKIIKEQQSNFELELRTYNGDDPFDVWYRYIKWTEQYFPKGGHDGHLLKLVERCLREFQDVDSYKNDPRFIYVWIKFASITDDPSEVYAYMFDNAIGVQVANLYVEWALTFEKKGDNKKADAIFTEGLKRCAEPKDLLLQRQQQFQSRVAKNITLQIAESQNPGMDIGSDADKRTALVRLKPTGSSHKVGAARTGSVVLGSAGSLKSSHVPASKQIPSRGIPIFQDSENNPESIQPQQTFEWQSLPVKAINNRENDKKPGVWTDAKVKQKPGSVPEVPPPAPFQIHQDQDAEILSHITPRKTTLINTQPLSSRKAIQKDLLCNIKQPQSSSDSGIPMYQKLKVYQGLEEFSFEELRAVKYLQRKREREMEAERLRKEEEQRQREEILLKELEQAKERIALLQAQLSINSSGSSQKLSVSNSDIGHPQVLASPLNALDSHSSSDNHEKMEVTDSKNEIVTPVNITNQSSYAKPGYSGITPSFNTSSNSSGGLSSASTSLSGMVNRSNSAATSSVRAFVQGKHFPPAHQSSLTPSLLASSSTNTSSCSNETPASHPNTSSVPSDTPLMSLKACESFSASQGLSNLSHLSTPHRGPTPDSFTFKKGSLTAASPTVFTKEAMQFVNGMLFNTSFNNDSQTADLEFISAASKPVHRAPFEIYDGSTAPKVHGLVNTERRPFVICEDRPVDPPRQNLVAPAHAPFKILEDDCEYRAADPPRQNLVAPAHAPFKILEDDCETQRQALKSSNRGKGLQIFCDSESKENMPKEKMATSLKASTGIQIYCDAENEEQHLPMSVTKENSCRKGFEIYTDGQQDIENGLKAMSVKKNACRSLGFQAYDVEMADGDQECQFADYTIECQAKNDLTLAPLDSFVVQARLASTPCAANSQSSKMCESTYSSSVTAENIERNTPSKHLSPIFEGSGDGSGESCQQTTHYRSGIEPSKLHTEESIPQKNLVQESIHSDGYNESPLDRTCQHFIDTTTCLPEPENPAQLALIDPFDDNVIASILNSLEPPLSDYPNIHLSSGPMPEIKEMSYLSDPTADMFITIDKCIGEGGYAKIYKGSTIFLEADEYTVSGNLEKVLKVQTPQCYWEFYVSYELRRRLAQLKCKMDVQSAVMEVEKGLFYSDGSLLMMKYVSVGSLLNVVNLYKNDRNLLSHVEPFACLLTIELLHMFEQIHKTGFIHADVKPDNFLFLGLPSIKKSSNPEEVFGSCLRLVQLIDFGQSIDMTKFPPGTTFRAKLATSGFQCIEMMTNRPWTYQTDLFGLAGTIHVVLFGSYMNVYQEHGVWKVTGNFVRKWNVSLWKKLFKELLNIPSCDQQPDLASLRQEFEDHFMQNLIPSYNDWMPQIKRKLEYSTS
ncbi:uncharacterized protein LOC131955673 [Physella acuta]|uniref:uncharacterized protein LOC131955673 n=1 Tax=Physella acuta TaxID=109671 RepID=UPI0027DBDC51|nr:uncharacterized protein LOC131955673 [Physella acuta]